MFKILFVVLSLVAASNAAIWCVVDEAAAAACPEVDSDTKCSGPTRVPYSDTEYTVSVVRGCGVCADAADNCEECVGVEDTACNEEAALTDSYECVSYEVVAGAEDADADVYSEGDTAKTCYYESGLAAAEMKCFWRTAEAAVLAVGATEDMGGCGGCADGADWCQECAGDKCNVAAALTESYECVSYEVVAGAEDADADVYSEGDTAKTCYHESGLAAAEMKCFKRTAEAAILAVGATEEMGGCGGCADGAAWCQECAGDKCNGAMRLISFALPLAALLYAML